MLGYFPMFHFVIRSLYERRRKSVRKGLPGAFLLFFCPAEAEMIEHVLDIHEFAAAVRCCPHTAYRILRSGKVRAVRTGNRWRVTESAVREFLNGGDGSGKSEVPRQAA
jgi:excisionase family DNA binding protein